MIIYLYIFLAIGIVSLVALAGIITLSLQEKTLQKILPLLVSLSVGSLLGGFFLHLLPSLVEKAENNFPLLSIFILAGILFFYLTEKIVHWHHHHTTDEAEHCENCHHIKPVGYMILISDGFHNFLDGVMIASTFLLDIHLGVITTILVLLHEIPQEIGDFGVLLNAGFSKTKALWFNFLSGLTAALGAILVIFSAQFLNGLNLYLTALAGGGFLYIALVDLIPELHQHKHNKKTLSLELSFVFLGILLMFGVMFLEKVI